MIAEAVGTGQGKRTPHIRVVKEAIRLVSLDYLEFGCFPIQSRRFKTKVQVKKSNLILW
jgi:hypothetical protein